MNADMILVICLFTMVFVSYALGRMHRANKELELEIALEDAIRKHGFESPQAIKAAKALEDYTA